MEYLESFRSIPLSIPTRETQFNFESVSWEQVRLHFSRAGDTQSSQRRRITLKIETSEGCMYSISAILSYIYIHIYHTIKEVMQPNYKKATGGRVQDVHGRELDG